MGQAIRLKSKRWPGNLLAIGLVAVWLFPIFWAVLTSLKTRAQQDSLVPLFFFLPTFDNYSEIFTVSRYEVAIRNSLIISIASTFFVMVLAVSSGYVLGRVRLRHGRDIAMWILSLRMIPPVAVGVPFYLLFVRLGWVDKHLALIAVYTAVGVPFAVWLVQGFFIEIPRELDEAATLDGLTEIETLWRVLIPVALPGISVAAIFTFIFTWNEYLLAYLLTTSRAKTVPLAVSENILEYHVEWGRIMASSMIVILPMLVIVFLLQRYIVRGLTLGAVK
jgi:multiple sugar transport system permease protein